MVKNIFESLSKTKKDTYAIRRSYRQKEVSNFSDGGFGGLKKITESESKSQETQLADFLIESRGPFTKFKSFNELVGYEDEKMESKTIVRTFATSIIAEMAKDGPAKKLAQEDMQLLGSPAQGVMFYGPAGTGKTSFARAMVRQADELLKPHGLSPTLYEINVSSMFSSYVGETESNLRQILNAVKQRPAIVFMDEVDGLYASGKNSGVEMRSANIMKEWLTRIANEAGVMVIAATNSANKLPEPMIRSGRFDKTIKLDFPTTEDKIKMAHYQKEEFEKSTGIMFSSDIQLEQASRNLNGGLATGADFETLFKQLRETLLHVRNSVEDGTLPVIIHSTKGKKRNASGQQKELLLMPKRPPQNYPDTPEGARAQFENRIDIAEGVTPDDFGLAIAYDHLGIITKVQVTRITQSVFNWTLERFNKNRLRTLQTAQQTGV